MDRTTIFKCLIVALLAILILIPLGMIKYKITERAQLRSSAEHSVAASWTREQQISGPAISVAYQRKFLVPVHNEEGKRTGQREEYRAQQMLFMPDRSNITANLDTDVLKRGIYPVRIYTANARFEGQFDIQAVRKKVQGLYNDANVRKVGQPFIFWRLSDPRGLNNVTALDWGGKSLRMAPGTGAGNTGAGIHAWVRIAGLQGPENSPIQEPGQAPEDLGLVSYQFNMELRGMNSIHFVPGGKHTLVNLAANWPHPKFSGAFLPTSRTINDDDFSAEWSVSEFAIAPDSASRNCSRRHCSNGLQFGVELVDPVDVYLQSERAAKYGFLFVALVFIGFALFELLKKLRIHPMQYTLVGVSIAMFFLLLISMAEHLGFPTAYASASAASITVIGLYLRSVLQSWSASLGFAAGLCALYGLLFVILRSEDYALLMGAILCFAVLATVMILTRKLDWYALGAQISGRDELTEKQAV